MTGYMLDTNILIQAIRKPQHPIVVRMCEHVGKDLYIS